MTISRGDSLYLTFKQLGLSQRDLALMTSSKPLKKKLARIAPGQEIEFYLDAESRVTRLVHRLDRIRSLQVLREGDTFTFDEVVEPPDIAVATATGVIDSSLFEAGQHAGLSDNIIMQMAEIFAWDVDFALDIRVGDRFALIFEEQFKGKEKVGEGPIIAAEFTSRGRRIRAVRYVDSTGHSDYFSPHGRSMRKAFLRTPVNFTRISSRFNLKRRHPILHKIRAHRGVDYAAPRGTTVKASGDGKVILAGRKGGYGRTVIVQHGSTYTTLYAHLSRFSKGIRPGKRVRQGQTIGYVGSTGSPPVLISTTNSASAVSTVTHSRSNSPRLRRLPRNTWPIFARRRSRCSRSSTSSTAHSSQPRINPITTRLALEQICSSPARALDAERPRRRSTFAPGIRHSST